MDKFKKVFESVATKYAEYVEAKVNSAAEIRRQPADQPQDLSLSMELRDEVRTVNVLAVTLARMEALEKGAQFGVNAGI